jgi:hypothetical protein
MNQNSEVRLIHFGQDVRTEDGRASPGFRDPIVDRSTAAIFREQAPERRPDVIESPGSNQKQQRN